ncbi:MAG: ribose-phosphate diphosphokinase [Steroidobacteraceae bacterium]|jgi:ribose-phosphate pyrophosphokinase|nr:ribose-phosphate diphosphokinase [Steroidobacteraceae bacterium]
MPAIAVGPPPAVPLLFAVGPAEALAAAVAAAAGAELGRHELREFERGEHKLRPLTNVRARDVAIVHAVHGDLDGASVNDRLLQAWFFAAAVRDAGARSLTLAVPYLPYARKDRRTKSQDPLGARYVAQHFEATGADRILVVEPHALAAFENAFRIEALALPFAPLVAAAVAAEHADDADARIVVVSPDVGGTKRAQQLRELLAARLHGEVGFAFVDKERSRGRVRGGELVGEAAGAHCLLVDDLVASGGTIAHAAAAVLAAGARRWSLAIAHALFLPGAIEMLVTSECHRVYLTDSVPLESDVGRALPTRTLALAPYLGGALRAIWSGGSLAELTGIGE